MAPDQALKSETQLPFEADAALRAQAAEFRHQQNASPEVARPGPAPDTATTTHTGKGG